jgi:hypothetical protein
MRIGIFIVIFLSIGCSQGLDSDHPLYTDSTVVKTDQHKRMSDTNIFAILPDSFHNTYRPSRYQTATQFIQFIEYSNISWTDYEAKEQSIPRERINIYGYKGDYLNLPNASDNESAIHVQFGDDDFVCMITASTSKDVPNGREELLSILKTIVYDRSE